MISRKTIRKVFEQLNIITWVEVTGEPAQVYNSFENKYYPDRNEKQLVLSPKVYVGTKQEDTSWVDGLVNSQLTEIVWKVNGVSINSLSEFSGKYYIYGNNEAFAKGSIKITKNVEPAKQFELSMEAKFYDSRNGTSVFVKTDPVNIFTTEDAEDEWDFSVVHDTNIKYRPLLDKLKEYNWKTANNIAVTSSELESCYDGNQYDLSIPIIVSYGKKTIEQDNANFQRLSMKMFLVSSTTETEISASNTNYIKELTVSKLRLDLRYIPDGSVMVVKMYVDNDFSNPRGYETLTFTRIIDRYLCTPTNESDIKNGDTTRKDKVTCFIEGRKIDYPEAYFDIKWYTNSSNSTDPVFHGSGENVTIDLNSANIGTGKNRWLEVYTECTVK